MRCLNCTERALLEAEPGLATFGESRDASHKDELE
jgi:hypothetical protein